MQAQGNTSTAADAPPSAGPEIAIVGTGFAGLCMAIRLKAAGIQDFALYEQAGDIGGTWRDNAYPGAACDVPSHVYSFSFAPNPDWSRMFGAQGEILDYLRGCVRRYGLQPHLRLRHAVTSARFDEDSGCWHVHFRDQPPIRARVLIGANGPLSRPSYPDIAGLQSFTGTQFHSARWRHDCDLAGKRVAVIGTGASAIQFVPQVAKTAGAVTLFQRTPPWVLPKLDRDMRPWEKRLFRVLPFAQKLLRTRLYWQYEMRALGMIVNPKLMRTPTAIGKRWIARHISDPALREKVTPRYVMGCKRILLSNDYYPALARPNVQVVTEGIAEVTPRGVRTRDGVEHAADVLILGTGFQVNDVSAPFDLTGIGGARLEDLWRSGGPQAYLGTNVARFPNFFFIIGPNTGLGHNSMVFMIESQVRYVLQCVQMLRARRLRYMDVRADVQSRFNQWLQGRLARTVWATGCHSWYLDRNGKNTSLWPGFTFRFRQRVARVEPADYHLVR